MRYLVCGSRAFDNYPLLVDAMENVAIMLPSETIVEGCARGADRLAERYARENDIPIEHHPADWDRHGKRAGIIRNIEMLDSGIACVLAFWDGHSRGTGHTIAEAKRRGVPVEVFPLRYP